MKRTSVYIIAAALAGLILGYLLFGGRGAGDVKDAAENKAMEHPGDDPGSESQVWTCSMHPQIRQPGPGDCPICGMELIPADARAGGLAAHQVRMSENAIALAGIRTTRVGASGDPSDGTIALSGRIVANQDANRVQASFFDGRIERLFITHEGQQVRQGQPLATLYAPSLIAAQQELLTAAPLKQAQPALYAAVRGKLKNWKLTDQQIDQIESEGSVTEHFPIYASVSGTVTELMTSEGDYVKAGQPIARLSNLSTLWADFDAYERQLEHFRMGQEITIVTNAFPNRTFNARVSFIDPLLDPKTRTVTLRATLENSEGILKPGMFVSGKIKVAPSEAASGLSVPASAVMWTGERSLVYVREQPGQPVFSMREVTLGARMGENYLVVGGLEAGEEIVVNGTFTVDAAAQLQGKKSMMNKSGGSTTTGHEGHAGMQGTAEFGNAPVAMELSGPFQEGFQRAIPPYLQMKDAFVAGLPAAVAEAAQKTLVEFQDLAGQGHDATAGAYLSESIELLQAIAATDQLDRQRMYFVTLNKYLVSLAQNLQGTGTPLYVQLCPMANENQGALWLSSEREIRNPYYGDGMLTCGSIVDSIQ